MRPFLHDRIARLMQVLGVSREVLSAHRRMELDTWERIDSLLGAAAVTFASLGLATAENEAEALRAQHAAARRGFAPMSTEKVVNGRREVERSVGLNCVVVVCERMRGEIEDAERVLADGREQVQLIVLHGLRGGVVALPQTEEIDDAAARIWSELASHADTRSAALQVAVRLASPDVHLVTADVLVAIAAG